MSKELAKVLSLWEAYAFSTNLDERNDDLCKAITEITQAAANKAAEEGGLPALPHTTYNGYSDGSEPLWTKEQMHGYATQAIAADRASRQVANKAEVDLSSLQRYRDLGGFGVTEWETGAYVKLADVENLLATPPATTGASTVLTNESENCPNCYADRPDNNGCADCGGTGLLSVAAQAGQVAVPEWVSVDERLPSVPVNSDRQFIIACQRTNGKTYVFAASYLNELELDSNDDGNSVFTGWHTEGEHTEYSSWYEPVCQAGEKVTHWQELPAAPSPAKESK